MCLPKSVKFTVERHLDNFMNVPLKYLNLELSVKNTYGYKMLERTFTLLEMLGQPLQPLNSFCKIVHNMQNKIF